MDEVEDVFLTLVVEMLRRNDACEKYQIFHCVVGDYFEVKQGINDKSQLRVTFALDEP